MSYTKLPARTSADLNSAADVNQLQSNIEALKGGEASSAPSSNIETLASGKIDKSTLDANTILKADTDDTPSALTVAEKTLVGRLTGGNIKSLTASEVRTLLDMANGKIPQLKQYAAVSVTGTNWTTTRAVFVPYQTSDGAWRLRFNITGSLSSTASSITLTVAGITFKNITDFYQAISCGWLLEVGVADRITTLSRANPGLSTLTIDGTSRFNRIAISGDVELNAKPTWAD